SGDGYLLILQAPQQTQEIELGGDLRVNEVRRKSAKGDLLWLVRLDEHDDKPGTQVPRLLHLSSPSTRTEVDLRLRNAQYGLPPPSGAFQLGVPPGMRVEEVR